MNNELLSVTTNTEMSAVRVVGAIDVQAQGTLTKTGTNEPVWSGKPSNVNQVDTSTYNYVELPIDQICIEPGSRFSEIFNSQNVKDLEDSIKLCGLLHPVTVTENHIIITGIDRLQACRNLGMKTISARILKADELTTELIAIDENIIRKEISVLERSELLLRRKEIFESLYPDKKHGIAGANARHGRASENISFSEDTAAKAKVTPRTVQHEIQIATELSPEVKILLRGTLLENNKLQLLELARESDKSLQQAIVERILDPQRPNIKKVREAKAVELRQRQLQELKENNRCVIESAGKMDILQTRLGDFQTVCEEIEDESIGLILTDPPYPAEYLPEWSDMAQMAARKLRPGGFLIAVSGHYHLPEVMSRLSEHLTYFWTCCLLHRDSQGQRGEKMVKIGYKPVLIYVKPPVRRPFKWFEDCFDSGGKEKSHHEWQQAVEPFPALIKAFSLPGDLILDPFAGSGTSGAACLRVNSENQESERRCLLIEKDDFAYHNMLDRLAKEKFSLL